MCRDRIGLTGLLTGLILSAFLAWLSAKTVAPVLGEGSWPFLIGLLVVPACALAGCVFPLCVSAYRDKAAEVTGYCHPVRKGSNR